jgi:hypothetical protein
MLVHFPAFRHLVFLIAAYILTEIRLAAGKMFWREIHLLVLTRRQLGSSCRHGSILEKANVVGGAKYHIFDEYRKTEVDDSFEQVVDLLFPLHAICARP